MKIRKFPLGPGPLLHLEALIFLSGIVLLYAHIEAGHWGIFALLFLFPDVALVPYIKGPTQLAAAFYNLLHTSALPLALGILAWHQHWPFALRFSLIWLAHIAFDRALGYGLKYPFNFKITHLQVVRNHR